MSQVIYKNEKQAIISGMADASEWMKQNTNHDAFRQRLAIEHHQKAQASRDLASELDEAGEKSLADEERLKANYHDAFADRLTSLERNDFVMNTSDDGKPKRKSLIEWSRQFQMILPLATMIAMMALGTAFGWPLWFSLLGAGVAARVVAQRRGANGWVARFWGIAPTLLMLLGFYWIPAMAIVVHVFIWKHPDDSPPPEPPSQGSGKFPRRV